MKRSNLKITLLLIMLALTCAVCLASCSDGKEAETEIISAELNDKENITLKATLHSEYAENHSGEKLYLLAFSEMEPESDLSGAVLVAESKVKNKMTFKFPLYGEDRISRIGNAFVVAEKNGDAYSAITEPYYISNPDMLAQKDDGDSPADGIKGFYTEDVYSSLLLGADNVLFEADMHKWMLEDFEKDAVRFDLDGVSYYYDKNEVGKLDDLVSDANSAGMKIYLRTYLGRTAEDEGAENADKLSFLYLKGADDAFGYLPDLSNERTVSYVRAFYSFIASRYNISEFLIGERVNDYGRYCNAGSLTPDEFEIMYSFWARAAYQTVRSVNSSASVIIPVDNSWRADTSSGRIGSKSFLSHFADNARDGGDYDYSVAVNLCDADDLSSLVLGAADPDYSALGIENLSDITKFLDDTDMRYKSEKRRVIVDGLAFSNEEHKENDCASYYVAAYYTAVENGFDAFFCSTSPYLDGAERKTFYYAAVMCGTSMNSQLAAYVEGIDKIDMPDFDEYAADKLTYLQSAEMEPDESVTKNIHELPITVSDLTPCGGAYDIQGKLIREGDVTKTMLVVRADTSEGIAAVSAHNIPAKEIVGSGYIALTMSSKEAASAAVVISSNDRTFIGETKISDINSTYYFDISGFVKDADSSGDVTLSVCFISDEVSEISAEITDISVCGTSGNGFGTILTIIIVAAVILLLVGLIILLVVKRKKKSVKKKNSSEA